MLRLTIREFNRENIRKCGVIGGTKYKNLQRGNIQRAMSTNTDRQYILNNISLRKACNISRNFSTLSPPMSSNYASMTAKKIKFTHTWPEIVKLYTEEQSKITQREPHVKDLIKLAEVTIYQLGKIRAWTKSMEVLKGLVEKKIQPSAKCYAYAMNACNLSGQWPRALELYSFMISQKQSPDSFCYKALISSYVESKNAKLAIEVLNEIKKNDKVEISMDHYCAAIQACNRCHELNSGLNLYHEMKTLFRPSLFCIDNIVQMLLSTRDSDGISKFIDEVVNTKNYSSKEVHDIYSQSLKASRFSSEICQKILSDMILKEIAPTNQDFQYVIISCVFSQKCHDALNILSEMKQMLIVPTVITYEYVIAACTAIGDLHNVNLLILEMRNHGFKRRKIPQSKLIMSNNDFTPFYQLDAIKRGQYEFSKLLRTLGSQKKWKSIIEMLNSACSSGFLLNDTTMTVALIELGNCGRWKESAEIVLKMSESQENAKSNQTSLTAQYPPPNLYHFSAAINTCAPLGKLTPALELFDRMKSLGIEPDIKCYNSLLNVCAKAGNCKQALHILQEMRQLETELDSNVDPDPLTYRNVILSCAKNGNWKVALEVFNSLRNLSIPLTTELYNGLISAYSHSGKYQMNFQLIEEMDKNGIEKDNATMASFIFGLARGNQWQKCISTLEEMKKYNPPIEPDLIAYNSAIYACARSGKYEEAAALVEKAKYDGLQPDEITYSNLSSAYKAAGLYDEAIGAFDEMKHFNVKPSQRAYNAMLSACVKGKQWEKAVDILQTMKHEGIGMDTRGANSGIAVSGKVNGFANAYNVIKEIDKAGIEPDLVNYACLMNVCMHEGEWRDALQILQDMNDRGIRSNAELHSWAMKILNENDRWDAIPSIFDLMVSGNIEPNKYSYSLLIHALKKLKRWRAVLSALNDMKRRGLELCIICYTNAMDACNQAGEFRKVQELFQDVIDSGVKPDIRTFESAVRGLAGERKWKEIPRILQLMKIHGVALNERMCCNAIKAFAELGQSDDAYNLFKEMSENDNIKPDSHIYTALILAFSRCKRWEDALNIFESMKNEGIAPTLPSYTSAISACGSCGKWEEARQLWRDMQEQGLEPDVVAYTALINAYGRAKRWRTALNLLRSMETSGIKPNSLSYARVISSCVSAGHPKIAENLLHEMEKLGLNKDGRGTDAMRGFFWPTLKDKNIGVNRDDADFDVTYQIKE